MSLISLLGDNIKLYREYVGLSQCELAQKSGISRSTIGYVEQGRTNLCITSLESISVALCINPCLLIAKPQIDIRGIEVCQKFYEPPTIDIGECAVCINTSEGMEFYPVESNSDYYVISMLSYLKNNGYKGKELVKYSQIKSVPLK